MIAPKWTWLIGTLALAACAPNDDETATTDSATQSDSESNAVDHGFEAHLLDAIAINEERKALYSNLSNGRSEILSSLLITSENSLLPMAREIDAEAEPFQEDGIPIVSADFISMSEIAPHDTPPIHRAEWTAQIKAEATAIVAPLAELDPADFETVCAAAAEALLALEQLEQRRDVHLAMTKHLLESAAYAALHAIDYAEQSRDATVALSKRLVAEQLLAPSRDALGPAVDEMASPLHQLGIGIIVNDVPAIPFLAEYASSR